PRPDTVVAGGRIVARGGERLGGGEAAPGGVPPTMDVAWRDSLSLARGGDRVKAIGVIADQLVTTAELRDLAPTRTGLPHPPPPSPATPSCASASWSATPPPATSATASSPASA